MAQDDDKRIWKPLRYKRTPKPQSLEERRRWEELAAQEEAAYRAKRTRKAVFIGGVLGAVIIGGGYALWKRRRAVRSGSETVSGLVGSLIYARFHKGLPLVIIGSALLYMLATGSFERYRELGEAIQAFDMATAFPLLVDVIIDSPLGAAIILAVGFDLLLPAPKANSTQPQKEPIASQPKDTAKRPINIARHLSAMVIISAALVILGATSGSDSAFVGAIFFALLIDIPWLLYIWLKGSARAATRGASASPGPKEGRQQVNPKKSDFRWGISLGGYLLVVGGLFGVVILGGGVDAAARHFLTIAVLVGVFWVPWALGERKKAKLAAEYETQRETQLAAIRKLDGSAHYATPQEIAEAFPAGAGLLFGWVWPRHPESGEWLASQWVRYSAATSIFTIAPAGTGKFVTSIAPALLDNNPQSFFVNDPKGEIYAVTASWRRQLPEHRVYLLDPFAVSGQRTDHYNPLLDLDPSSTNFESDAAVIAGALIYEDGGQGFFIDGARKLVAALLIYVCVVPGERRTLARVLELLNEDEIGFVTVMMKLKQLPNRVCGMAATPFLAKTQSKSTAEVLNTARTQLGDFLPYGAIEEVLSDSDFALSDLKQRGMTVYVVLPQGEALRFNRFTRLLFGWAFKKLQETPATKGRPPACLLIDEMGTCIGGNFELFQKQFALSRGFGFQIWAVFQDIPQAIDVFGEQGYRSALGNAGVLQFFATGEETTVEYIQKRAGTYTHVIDTGNAGFSSLEGGKAQTRAVPLLSQQHIQSLPKGEAIVFRQGFDATFSGGRKHYLEMPEYAQRAAPNPFAV